MGRGIGPDGKSDGADHACVVHKRAWPASCRAAVSAGALRMLSQSEVTQARFACKPIRRLVLRAYVCSGGTPQHKRGPLPDSIGSLRRSVAIVVPSCERMGAIRPQGRGVFASPWSSRPVVHRARATGAEPVRDEVHQSESVLEVPRSRCERRVSGDPAADVMRAGGNAFEPDHRDAAR